MQTVTVEGIYNEIIANMQAKMTLPPGLGPIERGKNVTVIDETNRSAQKDFRTVLDEYIKNGGSSAANGTSKSLYSADIPSVIEGAIAAASAKYGIDSNLIRAVIKQESDFNPDAVSHAGAMGLMQLMPGTANSLGVTDPFSVNQNIEGGVKFLRDMLNRFDGDEELALAAYNAGPGAVDKYGGIPPYDETQKYVPAVLNYRQMYLNGQSR